MDKRKLAKEYLRKAIEYHLSGKINEAKNNYRISIQHYPTSETFLYLGRVYSSEGSLDKAIHECINAIKLDKELGKAYNDVGSYYVKMGNLNEAILWFEKAIGSTNFKKRHYAYFNLGLVYTKKGMWHSAMTMFRKALDENEKFEPAKMELYRILALMN